MVDMMQVIKPVMAIIRNGVTDNEVIPREPAQAFFIGYFDSPAILSSRLYCTSIEGIPQEALIHVNIYFALYIV